MENRELVWVDGYEGRYKVARDGAIVSVRRNSGADTSERTVSPSISTSGYRFVTLHRSDGKRTVLVHRAVAMAYIPGRPGADCINHKNGDKLDNRVENLEWVTPRENSQHAVRSGLIKAGEMCASSRLSETQAREILAHWQESPRRLTHRQLAAMYRVSRGCIDGVVSRRNWRHLDAPEVSRA